ncbi:MAG: pyridoxamine 5'-phosphate oxidase family protein [Chloroflexi bacterium]|nr:pyridoxamine 5'-phosphate oxidase family protein [Chloroflexota bacterium]MCY3697706.1 pyridoxamine 5'-phosphate oxidase family protein [Chloroflexota bacterium]
MPMILPDEVKDRVNGALDEGFPLVLMAVCADAQPVVSFRGSAQTYGDDALAVWVRGESSSTLEAITQNPSVAMTYTNMPARKFFIFRGQAAVTTDQQQRDAIWEGQHDLEKSRDMERQGTAVIIRLDSVQGSGVNLTRD